ncbi:MAG: fructose-bisphosphatase class III [Planctomycetota bacterium]
MSASDQRPYDQDYELALLQYLSQQYPDVDSAMAEIARLSAVCTLPKGTVHVISDIHGEDKKLRHVINNASGTLRPLIEKLFADRLSAGDFQEFLTLTFYPAEMTATLDRKLTDKTERRAFVLRTLRLQLELARTLATGYSLKRALQVFPVAYRELLMEMMQEPTTGRDASFLRAIVDELVERGKGLELVHVTGRLVRNLAIYELIINGDCWDRGPRGDRVMDYLAQQPNVKFVWGNHDVTWLGAALGHDALICMCIRVSLRYRRLGQLDEGYSIPLTPLDHLVRTVYDGDPAERFHPKADGMRPKWLVGRMQKAIAIMQFKLEGQMIARHPEWGMDDRRLLDKIDKDAGTITLDGKTYPLRDTHLPTLDHDDPYALTAEEQFCLDRIRNSFESSQHLQDHVRYLVSHGSMYRIRDDHLIFHGCIPCDAEGNFLPMSVDGKEHWGRAMFDAIDRVVLRTVEHRAPADLDFLWYLWNGPRSPLFGKDRITTFERDFIEDKATHHEEKNAYFDLIHDAHFCEKVLKAFDVDPQCGLIVNGHVPVKIEAGESPLKDSGKAITIDGAFSEAYGDHGYTLVLEPERTVLAKHHHFESVEAAIRDGVDIVPQVTPVKQWDPIRRMGDTERGRQFASEIRMLERLIEAYRRNDIRPPTDGRTL